MFAYRCRHSGLYFPEDYIKEWGKKYGIGMGARPVSECLDTHDHLEPAKAFNGEPMLPVGVCYADVDLVDITPEEFEAKRAITQAEDPDLVKRVPILQGKQRAKAIDKARATYTKAVG